MSELILDNGAGRADSRVVPPAALGAWGLGLVWGALTARIVVRRRRLIDAAWAVGSTAAVAAAAALVAGESRTAAHVAAAVVAGWAARRTLEAIVERDHGRSV